MSNRVRSGILFGIFMAICFVVQNLLSYPADTSRQIIKSVTTGLIAGALAGFIFGWIVGTSWFLKLTNKEKGDKR
jgi:uncharacterized membrane protein